MSVSNGFHFKSSNLNIILPHVLMINSKPAEEVKSMIANTRCIFSVLIPNYTDKINTYYRPFFKENPEVLCKNKQVPFGFGFENFGLKITFNQPVILAMHDDDMVLDETIKKIIKIFGLVIFENACLTQEIKLQQHLNNFPHLNFHRDRNDNHDNRYSLYTRDPNIKEQYHPRTASTLFIDNAVAYLQGRKEGLVDVSETGRRGHYLIFHEEGVINHLGNIVAEFPWDADVGVGEIGVIDNRSVLHSSYKRSSDKGYSIGARYLF